MDNGLENKGQPSRWRIYIFISTWMASRVNNDHGKEAKVLFGYAGVARFYKPKIIIWINFRGACNGRCWNILWPFGIFYVHLVYSVASWYMLWLFGVFILVLVCFAKKNLATLCCATNVGQFFNICRGLKISLRGENLPQSTSKQKYTKRYICVCT
jgi:hypothetical protein